MSRRSDLSPSRPSTWPTWMPRWDSGCRRRGTVLAYTGDTGPSDNVHDLAAGADIFLAEATHVDGGEVAFHLTARQAARYASAAGVGCLVLTHLEPGVDPAVSAAQAREVFDGTILVAHPGLRI